MSSLILAKFPETLNTKNSKIPIDILKKIDSLFIDDTENNEVVKIIESVFNENWGVGQGQLSRSILIISEGDLYEIKKIMEDLEPKDVIINAEKKVGNPKHYFKCISLSLPPKRK